ncbi:MAG: multidrug efflux system outer membrane protein [Planctomycetota bacterium]|jgi:multidrug efflux system outer membrane protein
MIRSATNLLLAASLLCACAGDPPPRIDDDLGIAVPAAWSNGAATNKPDDAQAEPLRIDWWRDFGDERLDTLIASGLANNPNMQAVMARLQAAAAAHAIAGGPLLPEIDVGVQNDRARRLFLGFPFGGGGVPSSTVTTYGLSLGVRWEVDVWGRLRNADSAALADQQAAVQDIHAAQMSLAAQICRAWFAAIEARQQLDLADATAKTFETTLADVTDRFRRGVRPALEVHQAATNLANARASAAQRRDLQQRTMRQIDVLVGRYPSGKMAITKQLPKALLPVPAGLPSELLQRRPDLKAAERRVAAAGCRVSSAEAALYPRLSLTASGGTQSLDLEDLVDNSFRVWSVGANLLEPLFRGGALRAEVRRQQARRAEAFANYGNAVLIAFAEVENILSSDEQLAERQQRVGEAAKHAALARDLARERWQLGLTDFLTVADGQRQAFQTESARITVDRERIDNRIDLLLALGGGFGDEATGESR